MGQNFGIMANFLLIGISNSHCLGKLRKMTTCFKTFIFPKMLAILICCASYALRLSIRRNVFIKMKYFLVQWKHSHKRFNLTYFMLCLLSTSQQLV